MNPSRNAGFSEIVFNPLKEIVMHTLKIRKVLSAIVLLSAVALAGCTTMQPRTGAEGMDMPSCPCCKGMGGKMCEGMKMSMDGKGMKMCPPDKTGQSHAAMGHGMAQGQAADLYAPAVEAMHANMAVAPTGDADIDFVQGMIPHHQGAIDMATILLQNGHDPQIRKLAADIVKAQEGEIAMMKSWLKDHGR